MRLIKKDGWYEASMIDGSKLRLSRILDEAIERLKELKEKLK